MRWFRYCWMAALLTRAAVACSVSIEPIFAGPDFNVKVTAWGEPVRGARVEAVPRFELTQQYPDKAASPRYTAITDNDGIARFRHVRPGSYFVNAPKANASWIEVVADWSSAVNIALISPSVPPVTSGSLTGRIRLSGFVHHPQPILSLELREAVSGHLLSSVQTDETGSFAFPSFPRGRYFISMKASGIGGDLPVILEPGSSTANLDVEIDSSCGFTYVDRNR
jgi:hypothetical protein